MSERVTGLAEVYAMFGRLPQASREQLGVELAIISRDVLAAQRQDVAKRTGALASSLSMQLLIEDLRVKVGMIGVKARSKSALRRAAKARRSVGEWLGGNFYGRFVEFGRKAQTVLVTRGVDRTVRGKGSSRKVVYATSSTRLRTSGPNKGTPVHSPYKMRVAAKAGRPFIWKDRPEIDVAGRLANFFGSAIERAGGGA